MAKFYATGVKQVTAKNEKGKKVTTSVSVLIENLPEDREAAVAEANRIAKRDRIALDGVFIAKGSAKGAETLTKHIQKMRTEGTLPKF